MSRMFLAEATAPHAWTSAPRCFLYQAPRALGSLDLKKMPPIPVTRFMISPAWKEANPFSHLHHDQKHAKMAATSSRNAHGTHPNRPYEVGPGRRDWKYCSNA